MVTTPIRPSPNPPQNLQHEQSQSLSLKDFLENPPEGMEWVNGELIEKNGMTLRHSKVQGNIVTAWNRYITDSGQGGNAYTEAPCRTQTQGRRPDVAYLTPELVQQFGSVATLPQSFPLIAEIASPDDSAEMLFAKADEYLASGCEEVWIVFPESQFILVKTDGAWMVFNPEQTLCTQKVLLGFSSSVADLLA